MYDLSLKVRDSSIQSRVVTRQSASELAKFRALLTESELSHNGRSASVMLTSWMHFSYSKVITLANHQNVSFKGNICEVQRELLYGCYFTSGFACYIWSVLQFLPEWGAAMQL